MRVVSEAYVLQLSIFVAQRLALHQNGVEFRQLSIGDVRISLATSYNHCATSHGVAKKLADYSPTDKVTYVGRHTA